MLGVEEYFSGTAGFFKALRNDNMKDTSVILKRFLTILGNMIFNPEVIRYMNRAIPTSPTGASTRNHAYENAHDKLRTLFVATSVRIDEILSNDLLSDSEKIVSLAKNQKEIVVIIKMIKARAHPTMMSLPDASVPLTLSLE